MRLNLSRHRVLVTVPLSNAAFERLDTFFDVDLHLLTEQPQPGDMLPLLQDKAGAIVDARVAMDADLIRQLPMLKAVSVVEPEHRQLDLNAMTTAGIRATNIPADGAGDGEATDPGLDGKAAGNDSVAVEGLVASLGFGRRSFHPPYLLNPEVCCLSCC